MAKSKNRFISNRYLSYTKELNSDQTIWRYLYKSLRKYYCIYLLEILLYILFTSNKYLLSLLLSNLFLFFSFFLKHDNTLDFHDYSSVLGLVAVFLTFLYYIYWGLICTLHFHYYCHLTSFVPHHCAAWHEQWHHLDPVSSVNLVVTFVGMVDLPFFLMAMIQYSYIPSSLIYPSLLTHSYS